MNLKEFYLRQALDTPTPKETTMTKTNDNDLTRDLARQELIVYGLETHLEKLSKTCEHDHGLRGTMQTAKRIAFNLRDNLAQCRRIEERNVLDQRMQQIKWFVSSDKHEPEPVCDNQEATELALKLIEDNANKITFERNREYRAEKDNA